MKTLTSTLNKSLTFIAASLLSSHLMAVPPGVIKSNNAAHSPAQPSAQAPMLEEVEQDKTLMLKVQYADNTFAVIDAWVLNEKLPERKARGSAEQGFVFMLKNKSGDMMGQGLVTNPNVLRGILKEHGENESHGEQQLEESIFIVRYPYQKGMNVLSLMKAEDLVTELNAVAGRSAPAPAPSVELDFSSHL